MKAAMPWALCATLLAPLSACFNSSSFTPILTGITDTSFGSGSVYGGGLSTGATSGYVYGAYFAPGMTMYWDGKPRQAEVLTATSATIQLEGDDTRAAATAHLTAQNEGGYVSAPFAVQVTDATLALISASPAQFALGGPDTTVTLTGTGFRPDTRVLWNGTSLAMTFQSSTNVTATIPASLLAVAGDALVQAAPACSPSLPCPPSNAVVCSVAPGRLDVLEGGANDLAWDATHRLVFAALQGTTTFSVAAIDPGSPSLGQTVPAGPYPQLAISDQDQFLYVGSWDLMVRYALPGFTASVQLPAGTDHASWVAGVPGAPGSVAFSGYSVGIVDGTALRPNRGSSLEQAIAWGSDASTLYALSAFSSGVYLLKVDGGGVASSTSLSSPRFQSLYRLHYDRTTRRLYGDAGENVDEAGSDSRPFTLFTPELPGISVAAIDGAGGKAFFACAQGQRLFVRSFEIATQQPIATVYLSMQGAGSPTRMVRWGTSGLAVATTSRIFLYTGAFVH